VAWVPWCYAGTVFAVQYPDCPQYPVHVQQWTRKSFGPQVSLPYFSRNHQAGVPWKRGEFSHPIIGPFPLRRGCPAFDRSASPGIDIERSENEDTSGDMEGICHNDGAMPAAGRHNVDAVQHALKCRFRLYLNDDALFGNTFVKSNAPHDHSFGGRMLAHSARKEQLAGTILLKESYRMQDAALQRWAWLASGPHCRPQHNNDISRLSRFWFSR
jgi:hypothetical protein